MNGNVRQEIQRQADGCGAAGGFVDDLEVRLLT